MRNDKKEAIQLRTEGKSYNEIKKMLGVPKSTLSDWLHNIQWSKVVKNNLSKIAKEKSRVRLRYLNKIRG